MESGRNRWALRLLFPLVVGALSFGGAFLWQEQAEFQTQTPSFLFEKDQDVLREEAVPVEGEPDGRPDIVLIVLDTVRADHLGMYGYDRQTSPALDAWSKDARVWEHGQADGAWTLPSHASLFTGLPPREHGAHGTPLGARALASALHPDKPTLAERLQAAGYRTAGIAGNRAFLDSAWGLSRGFESWICEQLPRDPRGLGYTSGDRITSLAQSWLAQKDGRPRFLFLNYMDAHSPWFPRDGYRLRDEPLRRSLLPFQRGWTQSTTKMMAKKVADPATLAVWTAAYDASLRYLDRQVGTLLQSLPALGVGPEDYVVITSDHGEYLGEHFLIEHSKDVYQPVLHIPVIMRGPGIPSGRDSALIQLSDIAPRVFRWSGATLEQPEEEPFPGYTPTTNFAISELYWTRWRDLKNPHYGQRFNRVRRAFRSGSQKLILGTDRSEEAYLLSTDPGELRDLDDAPWISELRQRAITWQAERPETEFTQPGRSADMDALKALGYME